MKYSSLAAILLSLSATTGCFSQDFNDTKPPIRQSEDPSYETSREANRNANRTPKATKQPKDAASAEIVSDPTPPPSSSQTPRVQNATLAPITITEFPPGPRVKYILDGKPVYDGEPPVTEPIRREAPVTSTSSEPVAPRDSYDPRETYRPSERREEAPVAEPTNSPAAAPRPIQTQTARVAGRGTGGAWSQPAPTPQTNAVAADVTFSGTSDSSVRTSPSDPTVLYKRTPFADADDLTADKPGIPAAQNPNLLEEMNAPGTVNSRAKKCYALLAELKNDVETISRCLDNRGKENARLVHTSDELCKCISDMAAIWPTNADFRERSSDMKRDALLLNEELSQQPWRWAQVRWSYDAVLKHIVGYREYCRDMANQEPKPIAVVDKKTGQVKYVDAPDPLMTEDARRTARLQSDRDEITKRNKIKEAIQSSKKDKVKTDLDGN